MSLSEISAEEFSKIIASNKDVNILDVRTGIECRSEKLDCKFTHIPLHMLDAPSYVANNRAALDKGPLYILCRSGGRARKAAQSLEKAGAEQLVIVSGGLSACATCSIPLQKSSVWSLERQVRFVAGLLVLSGVLLGHFVSDGFYILSGFVGAGLIFAAVTEWCGMAMLLARAPWNNTDADTAICQSLQTFEQKDQTS